MATVKANKNADGKVISYTVRLCVGRDDRYKQVWRTCTIKRPEGLTPTAEKKEIGRRVDAWVEAQKADYAKTNAKIGKDKITLENFIREHWWKDHVDDPREHTPSTISFYRYMSEDIIDYFGPKKKLNQIDAEDIKRYVKYLRNEARTKKNEPYSATTVQHHFSTLRNILEYARRLHYISFDPCADLSKKEKPKRDNKGIDFLDRNEAEQFLTALDNECFEALSKMKSANTEHERAQYQGVYWNKLFWRCYFNVLLFAGLRRGEAVGLQWGDIDGKKMELAIKRNVSVDKQSATKIHIGLPKNGEEDTVSLSSHLYSLLMQLKHEQEAKFGARMMPGAFVFCKDNDTFSPIYPTTATRYLSKFIERNHFTGISPHDLRHTAGTLALEGGANIKQVQRFLRHKDPSTTMRFYAGVSDEMQHKTVDGIQQLLNRDKKKA